MTFKKSLLILFPIIAIAITFCNPTKDHLAEKQGYLNLNDTVKYVGKEVCRGCHPGIYETFMQTGMGKSFGLATREKSAARFAARDIVYDSVNNLLYKPLWIHDSLYVQEFRISDGDTVHNRLEHISYVVGSGQHTNSHICDFSGFLYQAPITFYTQSGRWDMAPGFEGGFNSRFDRKIGMECMTCHNALPEFDPRSENRFIKIPGGIDCERCHGPGEIHVKEKLSGNFVDTAQFIDYTIVNPRKLSKELQMNLCQRCHLQGVAVLNEGKSYDDFKPSMHLREVFQVFLPEYSGKDNFIMASQAERLRMSNCYLHSDLSCITCHNPHITVKQTPTSHFNTVCGNCHGKKQTECSEPFLVRNQVDDNCVHCHMPKSGSIDIPHVFITDHYIRKRATVSQAESDQIQNLVRLKCMTDDNPDAVAMAKGFLAFYEKYSPRDYLLDSAASYISKSSGEKEKAKLWVHYYYLKEDFKSVLSHGVKIQEPDSLDEWTLYRIGEAFFHFGENEGAYKYFKKATELKPLNLDFQNKLGATLFNLNRMEEAENVFAFILKQQPKYKSAWANLGYLSMMKGEYDRAEGLLEKAVKLDPDYELALLNEVMLYTQTGNFAKAKKVAYKVLGINPQNEKAKMVLQTLNKGF